MHARLVAAGALALLALPGLLATGSAHPGADAFSNAYLAHQHGRDALVVETNGLLTNGLQSYFGNQGGSDTGAQFHHGCLMPGWTTGRSGSYRAVYNADVFYNYIIAQDEAAGFDDAAQVASALAFWLARNDPAVPMNGGSPDWAGYDFEAACGNAGGAYFHPDAVLVLDDNAATAAAHGATGTQVYSQANPFPPTRRVNDHCKTTLAPVGGPGGLVPLWDAAGCLAQGTGNPLPVVVLQLPHA